MRNQTLFWTLGLACVPLFCSALAWSQTEGSGSMPSLTDTQLSKHSELSRRTYLMNDENGDGVVTLEEHLFHPKWGLAAGEPQNSETVTELSKLYYAGDTDGDGVVSLDEFIAQLLEAAKSDFLALDSDSDGEISFREALYPVENATGALSGLVAGTSFLFGATPDEVDAPHPYLDRGPYSANYSAYLGHAFARADKDRSFSLSFAEMMSVSDDGSAETCDED